MPEYARMRFDLSLEYDAELLEGETTNPDDLARIERAELLPYVREIVEMCGDEEYKFTITPVFLSSGEL